MSWFPALRHRAVDDERPWSPEEVALLAEAVRRAPSVHNLQPWSLRVRDRTAVLCRRPGPDLLEHDPDGRDQRISCGAAVANLAVVLRGLGWEGEVRWWTDSEGPDAEAVVTATRRCRATQVDRERRRAVERRSSYRRPFAARAVPHLTRTAIVAASTVQAAWVVGEDEEREVARQLAYAARANRSDLRYQRELGAWTGGGDVGLVAGALADTGTPAAGLVRDRTRPPGEAVLARWLQDEALLVFSTLTDGPRDHLLAGEAAERAWLEATRLGLVASVMTQPLRLSEVRSGIRDALGLAGVPQLLMRLGYPEAVPVPRTERRPLPDLFDD
ncbi:Acg family FMN-binding oxidoreductase [Saccharopolyspora rosea]|uniref:Acg family FMN-binding oxidoreductase n=1 Tax=Saccharopolyspora rosea TaxID=524884 RepID=A0ABW3FPN5_9PSEU|nr:nitroreductase family protein [Saccharopolyspora rosea]